MSPPHYGIFRQNPRRCFLRVHILVGLIENFVQRLAIRPFGSSDAQTDREILKMRGPVPITQV
jgi:hypothetical protein